MSNTIDSLRKINEIAENKAYIIENTLINQEKIITDISKLNNYSLYLAVLAVTLCIVLIIIIILQNRNFRERIIDIVLNSSRITQSFNQSKQNNVTQNQSTSNRQMTESEIRKFIKISIEEQRDKDINAIVDRVLECIQLDKIKSENKGFINMNTEPKKLAPQKKSVLLYATPADNSVFEKTTSEVTDDSFFVLTIDSNEKIAKFELLNTEKVTAKVLKVHDFLNTSCEKSGSGTTRIITTDNGRAELQPNGKWKIITKAKVKFE